MTKKELIEKLDKNLPDDVDLDFFFFYVDGRVSDPSNENRIDPNEKFPVGYVVRGNPTALFMGVCSVMVHECGYTYKQLAEIMTNLGAMEFLKGISFLGEEIECFRGD